MILPDFTPASAARSLYIHIPFCVSKCSYCDFFSVSVSHNTPPVPDAYIASVCRDISMQHEKYFLGDNLRTIYFGGGTPSLLTQAQLETVMRFIENTCGFSENIEVTLEANPAQITPDFLDALTSCGINRISVGVQSFSQTVIERYARSEKNGNVLDALDLLDTWSGKTSGKTSIDLIAGLEHETEKSLLAGIDAACAHNIVHLSLYALTDAHLATDDRSDELWLTGIERLAENGFVQYEVSNFARNAGADAKNGTENAQKANRCAHNLTYWNLLPYCGVGSGATGTVFAADSSALRYTQSCDIGAYITGTSQCENEYIPSQTVMREYLMLSFRLTDGVESNAFFERFGKHLEALIGADTESGVFSRWCKKGMAQKNGTRYSLTKNGLLFLNSFLQEVM